MAAIEIIDLMLSPLYKAQKPNMCIFVESYLQKIIGHCFSVVSRDILVSQSTSWFQLVTRELGNLLSKVATFLNFGLQ